MAEMAALEIVRDHSLYYKVRSSVTIVCRGMIFSRYPVDSHTCALRLSSYGYDTSQMRLSGKFTFDRTSQRVLNFHTEIRELELGQRVWIGGPATEVANALPSHGVSAPLPSRPRH